MDVVGTDRLRFGGVFTAQCFRGDLCELLRGVCPFEFREVLANIGIIGPDLPWNKTASGLQ